MIPEGLMDSARIPIATRAEITTAYCLHFLRQIRDVVLSTLDEDGMPASRVIDIMHADDDRIYFLAPRGKAVYADLIRTPFAAIVGQTTDFRVCRLRGPVVHPEGTEEQHALVDHLFAQNAGMPDLYPGDARYVIDAFYMEQGEGEYFDLGQKPLVRVPFSLGGSPIHPHGFHVTDACIGCGSCAAACPQSCIHPTESGTYTIDQGACMRCGICYETCQYDAIVQLHGEA